MRFAAVVVASFAFVGCVEMSTEDRMMVQELEHYGVHHSDFKVKSPAMAGMLSLLPGGGNFYLAAGNSRYGDQWAFGIGNLLFWPISPFWAVPQCAADAIAMNEQEMVYYYRLSEPGRAELEHLRREIGPPAFYIGGEGWRIRRSR